MTVGLVWLRSDRLLKVLFDGVVTEGVGKLLVVVWLVEVLYVVWPVLLSVVKLEPAMERTWLCIICKYNTPAHHPRRMAE